MGQRGAIAVWLALISAGVIVIAAFPAELTAEPQPAPAGAAASTTKQKDAAEAKRKADVEARAKQAEEQARKARGIAGREEAAKARQEKLDARQQQLEALQDQVGEQIRPYLNSELNFAHVACEPNREQRQTLKQAGDETLKDVAKKVAAAQRRGAQNSPALNPRKLILVGVAKAVRENLPPDQAARYQEELEKRTLHRRQTLVVLLVSKLDAALLLSNEQRGKITESLSANWQDAWERSHELWPFNEHCFPQVPDRLLIPFLDPGQRKTWKGLAQVGANQFVGGGGFGGFGQVAVEVEVENALWDEELEKSDPKTDEK